MVESEFEDVQVASAGRCASVPDGFRGVTASAWEIEPENSKIGPTIEGGSSHSHNSRECHTIHGHAPSRLASASVGVGVRVRVHVGVGVGGVGSSGVVTVGDNACMDGTLHDVIQSAPACTNSRLQGFTVYHDDSCARLNAFLNSRVERGHDGLGGTKLPRKGTLCRLGVLLVKSLLLLSRSQERCMLRGGQVATKASARCSPLGLLFSLLRHLGRAVTPGE